MIDQLPEGKDLGRMQAPPEWIFSHTARFQGIVRVTLGSGKGFILIHKGKPLVFWFREGSMVLRGDEAQKHIASRPVIEFSLCRYSGEELDRAREICGLDSDREKRILLHGTVPNPVAAAREQVSGDDDFSLYEDEEEAPSGVQQGEPVLPEHSRTGVEQEPVAAEKKPGPVISAGRKKQVVAEEDELSLYEDAEVAGSPEPTLGHHGENVPPGNDVTGVGRKPAAAEKRSGLIVSAGRRKLIVEEHDLSHVGNPKHLLWQQEMEGSEKTPVSSPTTQGIFTGSLAEESVGATGRSRVDQAQPSGTGPDTETFFSTPEKIPEPVHRAPEDPDMWLLNRIQGMKGIIAVCMFHEDHTLLQTGSIEFGPLLRIARLMAETTGRITPRLDWGPFIHMTLQLPEGNVIVAPYRKNHICIFTTDAINIGQIRRILRNLPPD